MITIAAEDPDHPEILALLAASDSYAASLYPAESNHGADLALLRAPGTTFFVARDQGGGAVGCAALVRASEWAEVKRVFVLPQARGRGVGRRLLETVERAAEGLTLRLETGILQRQAIALYKAAGFVERGPFGGYAHDPLSLFMERPAD